MLTYPKTPSDLPSRDGMRDLTGLEIMQGILAGKYPSAPICIPLGYRLFDIQPGHAVFRGTPTFEHANPMGVVHGGWYGTLLDSAMGCAVLTKVPARHVYTTLEYKINIVRPIPYGTEIDAISTASHVGRSTGVAEGQIVGVADGKLYATGSTTCIIMAER